MDEVAIKKQIKHIYGKNVIWVGAKGQVFSEKTADEIIKEELNGD